jgi:hypothetical protein
MMPHRRAAFGIRHLPAVRALPNLPRRAREAKVGNGP